MEDVPTANQPHEFVKDPKVLNIDDFLVTCIPTRSTTMDIPTSRKLGVLPYLLKKNDIFLTSNKHNVDKARTACVENLKKVMDEKGIKHGDAVRILWVDDDMKLRDSVHKLVDDIKAANDNDWNLIANYHNFWGDRIITNTVGHIAKDGSGVNFLSNDDLSMLKNYDPIPECWSAMGFCYVKTPLDYVFQYKERDDFGEDIHFFKDTGIPLRYWDLNLRHRKSIDI